MTEITISIISHGNLRDVKKLLTDIQDYIEDRIKIIITFNIPEENSILEEYKSLDIELIYNKSPKGFAANHNNAFKKSDTKYFAVVNPDIRLNKSNPFKNLIFHLSQHKNSGVASPIILDNQGEQDDFIRSNLTPYSLIKKYIFSRKNNQKIIDKKDFYWIGGMFLVFRSKIYSDIGGFDERYFLYCEDCDICMRLFLKNYTIDFLEESSVIHNAQRSSHKSFRFFLLHLRSLFRLWFSYPFIKLNLKLMYKALCVKINHE